jgi:uncharacterized protein (DUF934 family)
MALIDSRGKVIADEWTYPDADGAPVRAKAIVPLDVLSGIGSGVALERPIGALVTRGTAVELIVQLLDRLDLVVVEFPKFRDGRGFTIARALRERHGFTGEIRAIGHVLPDQFDALVQCGFSSIVTPDEHPPEQWARNSTPSSAVGRGSGPLLHRLVGRGVGRDVGH